jgi:hypothetical protein
MFIIKGKDHSVGTKSCNGRTEEIDSADTEQEAETLLGEYRLAFGPTWTLWIDPASN